MATLVKKKNPSSSPFAREVRWEHTEIAQYDILDISTSLGRPAIHLEVSTASDASITFRVNPMSIRFPPLEAAAAIGYPAKDLSNGKEVIEDSAPLFSAAGGEVVIINNFPISNLEIRTITAGSGISIRAY